ncbi:MAG TPA: hypothetical protein PLB14_03405 [Smithellaceae bacterium]|mgnify:FL=1|jgi:hypothetical protein|nr:hypothetical protein [Syntrophaceae bacterium]HPV48728.1 hypothetical protein [Smithellaceae bacterium]
MNAREQFVFLDALAAILIRCFFLAVAVLLLCFVFFILAGDYGYYLGSLWFDIDEYDYTLLFCYSMVFLKICAFMFFFFPYIAIRLVLRKRIKQRYTLAGR